jgi:hypothetical protein
MKSGPRAVPANRLLSGEHASPTEQSKKAKQMCSCSLVTAIRRLLYLAKLAVPLHRQDLRTCWAAEYNHF